MRAAVLALALVWSACPQPAAGCDFPILTDAAGRAIPDAFVRVTATPRSGGHEVERGLFLAKVSSFGPCPPKKADAVPLPIRLANPSGAILLLPPTMLWQTPWMLLATLCCKAPMNSPSRRRSTNVSVDPLKRQVGRRYRLARK